MMDVRDEALGVVLDREASRTESTPSDRLPEVIRRGSRMRALRLTAIAASVAVFVGAMSWAGLRNEGSETIPAHIADWRTFASLERNGWTIQIPPPWQVVELPACPNAPERIGLMVTNVEFEFRDPRGGPPDCEDRLLFAGFPRDGVAFEFMPVGIRFGIFRQPFDTVLPLTSRLLHQTDGIRGGPAESFLGIWAHRSNLAYVRRFEGPDASSFDVRALDRMLASLSIRGAPRWIEDEVSPMNELDDLRVNLTRPSGWNLRTYPHWSVIDAPNPIAALQSPGISSSPDIRSDGCRVSRSAPWIRVDRFQDPGVLVLISDATDSWSVPDLGARPEHFRIQDALDEGEGRCGRAIQTLRFGFKAAGRQIYVDVMASWSVLNEQPEMLLHILDSIRISRA